MKKFRFRLLFALITLIATVLICSAILLAQLFKTYYLNMFDQRLENEGSLLAQLVEEKGGIFSVSKEELLEFSKKLNVRITVVNTQAKIILDSNEEQEFLERHSRIIESTIAQNPDDRSSLDIGGGYNLHYYATPILRNKEIEGYIFLSTMTGEIESVTYKIWWLLTISLGIALVVILLLGIRITNLYTKPIESATNVVIELAKGNFRARTYEDYRNETSMLSTSINILARNFQEIVKTQEMQQDRLSTLIESMGSGLILIDNRGYISLINKSYKEIFSVDPNHYLLKQYNDVIEHKLIKDLVEEIFMTEQKVIKQLQLPLGIERRYFEVYGSPIIGTHKEWKGVLLVFHEITELKKLEQMRKDFVANVSHELKTPITSIKGFSETLLDGAMNDKGTLEAFLSIILKESDRLQMLIQDLLDLSKIEQQGFRLDIEDVNLYDLLTDVKTMLEGKAEKKNINLDFICNVESPVIRGDYYRLKQVFINLVSNAITYTFSEGQVLITIKEEEGRLVVQVADTGIGIEKDEIPRIFERFYRVDRARSRNSGGTGLGLAIVKHIVEAHKGLIAVHSEVEKGSTFSITFESGMHKN